jgi:hypothetical protein
MISESQFWFLLFDSTKLMISESQFWFLLVVTYKNHGQPFVQYADHREPFLMEASYHPKEVL